MQDRAGFIQRHRRLLRHPPGVTQAVKFWFRRGREGRISPEYVSASKLSAVADALGVSVSFFFIEGAADHDARMEKPETIELIRCYYALPSDGVRQQFLQMVKAVAASSERRRPERDAEPIVISATAAAGG